MEPTRKNVPGTSLSSRMSRTLPVHSGSGPSSKVSTIVLSGTDCVRAVPPRKLSRGPPSRTLSGTLSALAPERTRWSLPTSARR